MDLIKDPRSGDFVMAISNPKIGAAPLENGDISVQLIDVDTDLKIVMAYPPEIFEKIKDNFNAAYGSRIVVATQGEVKQFGKGIGKTPNQGA